MSRQATQSVTAPAAATPQEVAVVRSPYLDASLQKAHQLAMSQHHAAVSLEHLLFALTEDPEALLVLGASTVDVERLRGDITTHLGQLPNDHPAGKPILPTNDLLRVLKLAATAAQQSARRQMDGAIVIAAIIGDASTPSAGLLRAHGLTFQEVIRVLQRSAAPVAPPKPAGGDAQPIASVPQPKPAAPASGPSAQSASPTTAQAKDVPPVAKAEPEPVDNAAPSSGQRQTTEELLESVRARLQKSAPAVRRSDPAQPSPAETTSGPDVVARGLATEDAGPPTVALPRDEPAIEAQAATGAARPEVAHAPPPVPPSVATTGAATIGAARTAPSVTAPSVTAPSVTAPSVTGASVAGASVAAAAVTAPAAFARPDGPRTPADLIAPPKTKPTIPWPSPAPPTPLPERVENKPAGTRSDADPPLQPPLPLVPAAAQRSGPPPLPLPTVSSAPAAPPRMPPMPPLAPSPTVAAASTAREGVRPPPIPPPNIDLRALVHTLPRRLRQGQSDIIEVVVPRRGLEIPFVAGHRWPPLRVATIRLKSGPDEAHIELASPETLWISPPRVHQGADDAIWRWRVTPRNKGRIRLSLAAATRIVGSEGISAEVPLGEEIVEIDVARRGSRRGLVGLLLFGNLMAIGLLAMIMSGRAGQVLGAIIAWVKGLVGG